MRSERMLLLLLAAVQFTHIVDFMILMPLGPQMMRMWGLEPSQFNRLVSVYTVVAGLSGFLAAPWVDRFDRRRVLLWFYGAFVLAGLGCAASRTPGALLVARGFSGFAGGIAGTTVMAIVADLVPAERRGAAMGILMTAFSAAAAMGVPLGLMLAQAFEWESAFFALAGLALVNWVLLWRCLPSVRGHLEVGGAGGFRRFVGLLRNANAGWGLVFMSTLVFGHFAIIPLLASHLVGDLGLAEEKIPWVYLVGGVASSITGPWVGRLADRLGHRQVFTVLVCLAVPVTLGIALPGRMPTWAVLALAGGYFVVASGRFTPAQAILSMAVSPRDRGAYMSLGSCVRDLAGGLSATIGGAMVTRTTSGGLEHFDRLGWMAVAAALATLGLVGRIRRAEGPGRP